jgi:hypothetical protein
MWNSYWTFLDYLELRRRVEKRLMRGTLLLLHISAFVLATIFLVATRNFYEANGYFIEMNKGYFMAAWSLLLVVHAIWTYANSGAAPWRRSEAIEREVRERVRNDDSYLSQNPKDLFRVHGLLESDIAKRSSAVALMSIYGVVNAFIWVPWAAFSFARDTFAWQVSPILAIGILLPLLGFSLFSNAGREKALRKQMENLGEPSATREDAPKQKRYAQDTHMRLTDDGELLTLEMEDEDEQPKVKRR